MRRGALAAALGIAIVIGAGAGYLLGNLVQPVTVEQTTITTTMFTGPGGRTLVVESAVIQYDLSAVDSNHPNGKAMLILNISNPNQGSIVSDTVVLAGPTNSSYKFFFVLSESIGPSRNGIQSIDLCLPASGVNVCSAGARYTPGGTYSVDIVASLGNGGPPASGYAKVTVRGV